MRAPSSFLLPHSVSRNLFRSNLLRILGIGALSLHLAAAEDDCTIRILVGDKVTAVGPVQTFLVTN